MSGSLRALPCCSGMEPATTGLPCLPRALGGTEGRRWWFGSGVPLVTLSADGIAVRFSPGLEVSPHVLSGMGSHVRSAAVRREKR